MNKKKILALSLVAALLAIFMISGSLAWFTDSDQVTNVFTVGSVEITQNENFTQDSQLLPAVPDPADPTDPSKAGNFVTKEVTVSNVGKNPAYVQTFVAVPAVLDQNDVLEIYSASADWTVSLAASNVPGSQIAAGETNAYNIYKYVYGQVLQPNTTTSNAIDGVYINSFVDMDVIDANTAYFVVNGIQITGFNALEKVNVYVATQAIQSEGFADGASALGTLAAHPWAN